MVKIPLFILLFVNDVVSEAIHQSIKSPHVSPIKWFHSYEATRKRGEDPIFYSMKKVSY